MVKSLLRTLVVCLVLLNGLINPVWSDLTKSPPSISEDEIVERVKFLTYPMTWESTDKQRCHKSSLGFDREGGQTNIQIQFEDEFPQEFFPYESLFTLSVYQEKKVWTFRHGHKATDSQDGPPTLEEAMGVVHTRRILEAQFPQALSLPEITKLIHNKHCVFYTGAGISSGVVPTMPQLEGKLQFKDRRFSETLLNALKDPTSYIRAMDEFYEACLFGKPTPAHFAIRDLVQKKDWGLLTENLDLLHQRTGIKPLHREGSDWLKANVCAEDLKKIDYVITIGLASDESGFLGWYKANNPGGTIIALNLQQPNYLGSDDVLITGDAQQLVPLLRDEIF